MGERVQALRGQPAQRLHASPRDGATPPAAGAEAKRPKAGEKPILLSLCMIVKNEAKHLPRCLESVRGVVDEVVLVDTGSTDDTVAVAQRCGARVFHFPWREDFSAARNEANRHARGKWILSLDADEALTREARRKLRPLLTDERYVAYLLNIRSPLKDARGQAAVINAWPRLFRNRPEIRYAGRIHEQISPSIARMGGMVAATDLVVDHLGYHQDFTDQKAKQARNLALLRRQLAEHPNDPMVLFHLGEALGLGGEIREAAEAYRQAIACPDMPPQNAAVAYRGLANCLLRLGDYAGVIEASQEAAKLDPGYGLPRLLAAMALCRMNRPAEAIEAIDTYLRLAAAARPAAQRVLEHESSPGFALALKGDCLLGLGHGEEAESAFREALRRQPDSAEAHLGLGRIHSLRSDFAEAVRAFQRAKALFRDLPRGHLALAEAYAAQRKWGDALDAVEAFLAVEPRDPRGMSLRAEALLHAGRRPEAEAAFQALLKVDETPEAHLALACLADARGATDDALAHCRAALALGGEDPRIFFLQGVKQMARGEWAEAEASLLEALRRAPETPEVYQQLGAVALSRGDEAKALAYFQELLALAPEHPLAQKAVPVLQASLAA
jgi:tetratricopeptide (TPR) repeat protein